VGISEQEMAHANWRLDNPPVVDVAVSRRMGLFVVGRLAARHGVRVRLRHAQSGGLTALIWLPESVAAPESAQPLGRLRKFDADDFGPPPSLSAPTPTLTGPGAAGAPGALFGPPGGGPGAPGAPGGPGDFGSASAAAAAAARIPRFSSGAQQGPGGGFGAFGSGEGNGAPSGGGNGGSGGFSAFGGNGGGTIDVPGGPLPTRQPGGRGSQPGGAGNGSAFGGSEFATPDFGTPDFAAGPGDGGNGVGGSDGSQVTIPSSVSPAQDQRLPIFDSLESDWFRRSGKSLSSTASEAGQTWSSPADEGWRAARVVASPAAGETTTAGLPKRVPRANLVPGSVGGGEDTEVAPPARSAETIRTRMASFQRGVREARAAAPQIEEP